MNSVGLKVHSCIAHEQQSLSAQSFDALCVLCLYCASPFAFMAAFLEKFQRCLETTLAKFDHGLSKELIAELEGFKPDFANLAKDDACLRAWKKIEKVYFVIYLLTLNK